MNYSVNEEAISVMDYLEDFEFSSGKEAMDLFIKDINENSIEEKSDLFKENLKFIIENKEKIIKIIDENLWWVVENYDETGNQFRLGL